MEFHVPQMEAPFKVWGTMIGCALAAALFEYGTIQGHRIAGWGDLYNAMPQVTFEAAKAIFYTTILASPLSKRALEQRKIMRSVTGVGERAQEAALQTVASMDQASNEAVVQQLDTIQPPASGKAIAVVVPPKE